jgi:YD repeat-containing protein
MVAIFTGLGTGFERGSGSVLGSQGLLGSAAMGRGNEQVFLNAATGNLMISQQDEFLVGLGPDAAINRTYNSQGDLSDDNGDNWRFDAERKVFALTGTINTAGSTVQRMSSDGSVITYAWDSSQSAYLAKDGSGAYDKLTYNSGASIWTWTQGDSQITETYGGFGSNNWVLSSQTDPDGLSVTFDHVNGTSHVNRVTTADGSWVQYDWSGNNVSDIVTGYTDLATNTSKTLTRTRYSYDASNRLQTVTVDLSPNDNSIADGKTYTTTYNYVGTTKLIASIVQSDGSQVSIGYDQTATPATSKVTSITETVSTGATRTSTIAYSAGYTTVTDALGQQVRLDYDGSDNLTRITMPPASAGAAQQATQFTYDSSGNVASVTHGTLVAGPTELVSNGTFDSSAGWSTTGNTTFAGGTANVNSPSSNFELYQLLSMPSPGTQFDVTFTVSNYVSGAIAYIAWGGGGQVLGQSRTGNGAYTERFTVPPGGAVTIPYSGMVSSGNGFVGTIDNLSVRPVAVGPQDQTSYTYDANGNVASITDPLGNITTRTYGPKNELLSETSWSWSNPTTLVTDTFESPDQGTGYVYTPTISGFAFTGGSGLAGNDSAWGFANAPDGDQVAFVQGNGSFSQSLTGLVPGTQYAVKFKMAARPSTGGTPVTVGVNGASIGTFTPGSTAFQDAVAYFTALGTTASLSFSSNSPIDVSTAIDSVSVLAGEPAITHYAYDGEDHLRFQVSPEGDVTEYRYNSSGLVTSTIQYSGAQYTGSTFDEPTLNNWVGGLNPTVQVQRTDTAYDARGEVATVTSYAELYRNRLTNPAFAGTAGWAVDDNPNNIVANGTAYSGTWAGTPLIKMDLNATAAGQVASIGTDDSHSVDVYPGETLFAQVGAETLGSATTAQLVVHFWDANGNYLTGTTVQTLSGNNLSYNTKLGGYVAVPAGAAKARLEVYAYTSGAGAGSLALTSPILESATGFADSGGNLVQDSRFEDGTGGWSTWGQGSNVVQGGLTVGTDASTGKRYAQVTFNSGSTGDLVNIAYAGVWPIEGGERVAVRAGIGATSGVGPTHLDVQFLDANGAVVSEQVVGTLSGGQSFNTQIAGFAQAPANAVSMRLLANFWASATNTSQTVTLTEPYVAKATAQQSTVPAFTPGVPLQSLALDGAQSATYSRTGFVYDQSGKLLSSQVDGKNAQTYVYDGLGRLTSAVDLNGGTTTYAFNDTNTTTTVTLASGLVETSTYNKLGQLLAYSKTTEPNYIANDLLLDGTDGWRPNNLQVVAGPNDSLPFVFQQTSSATDGYTDNSGIAGMRPVPPGTTFNLSYQAKPGASGQQFQSGVYWFDSAGNYISGSAFDSFPSDTNNFTTIQNQVTKPSNAAFYYVYVLAVHGSVGQFGGLKLTAPTSAASSVAQTDIYKYDLDGQLRVSTDATGRNSYYIYDQSGRKVADVLNSGHMVEYKYDADNRVIATVDYGGSNLTSTQLATLDNPNAAVDIASFRPASSSSDLWSWTVYDKDGHVLQTIDGAGDTCVNAYDGNGRLVSTTHYFNKIGATTLAGFQTTPPSVVTLPATDARDVVSRNFYDKDGLLVGQLDGNGFLRQIKYDGAGQKIEDRYYAHAPSSTLWASGTFNALVASTAVDPGDRVTFYSYDGEGQLRFVTDANGNVTQTDYDEAGLATGVTRYAVPIASTGNHGLDNVKALLLASGAPSSTQNRQSWTVYDSAGRAAYTIDGEGAVTSFAYDGSGQVIKAVQFAAARPTSSLPDKATLDSWAASNAGNPANRTTRDYYDGAGVLRYTVDAEGYATRRTEDAEGRLLSVERFANPIATDDTTTIATLQSNVASSGGIAAVTSYTYDRIGRLVTVTDPEGSVTQYDHGWGTSNLTTLMHVAAGTPDESLTSYVYDNAGRVLEEHRAYGTADEAVTKYSYDGLGNRLTVTDPDNHVTSFSYDKIGAVTQKVDALNGSTTYTHDAFGNIIQETDPLGRSTYNYYDALDRLIRSRDAEDYVTATGYDAFGDVTSVIRYFNRTTAAASTGVWPDVTVDSRDAATSFQYDRLGRVVVSTDAQGGYEQYVLNAFGDRTTVRNKLGGTITNTYDRRGLLLSEILPMGSTDSAGTQIAATVTNKFSYDARGNRTQMIEAFGLSEQRTTNYTYDKADRLITKSGDAVTTVGYNDFTSTTTITATSSSVVPTESYVYDRRGNLIQVTDANGAKTFSYYDKVGRKIAEVNALGTLTSSTYDAAGNKLTDKVYGDFLASLPSTPGGSPPNPIDSSNYRQTSYAYDLLNRLTSTSIAGALVGSWNGTTGVTTATQTVSSSLIYDANGNVVKSTDANGNATFTYYDSLGRKTVQVDALNYVTKWTYDAEGNVLSETRFATALAAAPVVGTVPAMPASSAADRVTNFTYDRNGHRLTETRTGVAAWTVSSSNGALSAAGTSSVVTYTYNALGQVLTKVEATGDKVAYAYDQTGRLTKETRTIDGQSYAYADQTGANVTPEVVYSYNGLNNLTRTQQGNQATIEASATAGRITTYAYSAGGRLASMTDAAGGTHSYDYDAAGNQVRDSYARLLKRFSDGSTQSASEAVLYRRDLLGRVVTQTIADLFSATRGDSQNSEFDAYGEVSRRGVNGLWQESFTYNNRGLVEKTNSGDGVLRFFAYDANGNQTLAIESAGNDLSSKTLSQLLTTDFAGNPVGSAYVSGLNATISLYDKRNQATQVRMPQRELAAGASRVSLNSGQTYNAFGEVATQTDAAGNMTTLAYNTMGRVIQKTMPQVSYTDESGAVHANVNPVETYYYDLSGRAVGKQDANGNIITQSLLAGTGYGAATALTTAEFHPDGGVAKTFYDVFGDARILRDELNQDETHSYDGMGRLITLVHRGGLLTDNYTYDLLGQRLTHTDNVHATGESAARSILPATGPPPATAGIRRSGPRSERRAAGPRPPPIGQGPRPSARTWRRPTFTA